MNSTIAKLADEFEKMEKTIASQKKMIETLMPTGYVDTDMQGIFAWLVAGYFKYKRFGLKMSPAMRKVVNQYERDNDLCLQFLEERCEQAEGVNTRSKSLFDAYKIWCKSNGYFACSAKRFNADMETHPEWHGGKVVYQGYPVYKNLKLKGAS